MMKSNKQSLTKNKLLFLLLTGVLYILTNSIVKAEPWQEIKKTGVLRCGVAVAAPQVMRDPISGEYSGYFVDICQGFAEDVLKVKAAFVTTNWDNIIAGLQSNKWDLALDLNETPERAKAIAFSEPVTDSVVSFVYNKQNPKLTNASNAIDDFDQPNITLAVMSGTSQDKAVSAVIKKAKIMRLPGMDETRLAIMSRRADVLVDIISTNDLFVAANQSWTKSVVPQPELAKEHLTIGLNLNSSKEDIALLNQYIQQLKDTGKLTKMMEASMTKASNK